MALISLLSERHGALAVIVPGAEEDAAADEICALYYTEGDPTGGHRSQNATLFVDHRAGVFELEGVDGEEIEVTQQSDHLRLAGVTGCVVWNGAVVLAKSLFHWTDIGLLNLNGLKVLELGSGTGALAVACAMLGARVVATEQSERMKLLQRNVEKNCCGGPPWRVGKRGGSIEVQELDWFSPPEPIACNLVIATDVVYTEEVTLALVHCLSGYTSPVLLSVELRTEHVHYAFIEALAATAFTAHRLPTALHAKDVQTRRVVTYVLMRDRGRGKPETEKTTATAVATTTATIARCRSASTMSVRDGIPLIESNRRPPP